MSQTELRPLTLPALSNDEYSLAIHTGPGANHPMLLPRQRMVGNRAVWRDIPYNITIEMGWCVSLWNPDGIVDTGSYIDPQTRAAKGDTFQLTIVRRDA